MHAENRCGRDSGRPHWGFKGQRSVGGSEQSEESSWERQWHVGPKRMNRTRRGERAWQGEQLTRRWGDPEHTTRLIKLGLSERDSAVCVEVSLSLVVHGWSTGSVLEAAEWRVEGSLLHLSCTYEVSSPGASEFCASAGFNLTAAVRRRDCPSRTDARPGLPEVVQAMTLLTSRAVV